jgi:APA family basic amino acid/polyamine antiporter
VFGSYLPALRVLAQPQWHAGAAVALTAILMVVNVIGIQESSLLNLMLALLDLGTQVVLVVLGVWLLLNVSTVIHNVHWGVAPTWGNFLASISIAMVTYTGIETISNMSEEAKNPGRTVPRATLAVIAAVLFVSAFLPTIGMSVFPVHPDGHGGFTTDLATRWKDDPVAGIVTFFRPEALAFWSGIWVAILAFTILVIATNAGLIGISRLSYSLASNDLFPGVFSRLHPRYRTPFVSIIVFGIVAGLLMLPAQIDLMASIYSLAATFAFATAHLAVMRLRFVEPHLRRPFRMPLNIPFGRSSIPLLSVIGALGIGAVFTQLFFQNIQSSTFIFVGWLAAGVVTFMVYRRLRRRSLWQPMAMPPPEPHTREARQMLERAADPYTARVRVGRRHHLKEVALTPPVDADRRRSARDRLLGFASGLGNPRRALTLAVAAACLGVAVVAVLIDLSPLDPFGPGLGWSPGVIVIAVIAVLLLAGGRDDQPRL